jgi:hypothetical protein
MQKADFRGIPTQFSLCDFLAIPELFRAACVNIGYRVGRNYKGVLTLSKLKDANERVCVWRSFCVVQGSAARWCKP